MARKKEISQRVFNKLSDAEKLKVEHSCSVTPRKVKSNDFKVTLTRGKNGNDVFIDNVKISKW